MIHEPTDPVSALWVLLPTLKRPGICSTVLFALLWSQGCATVGPLRERTPPPDGFACAPAVGSADGLSFALELPANLAEQAIFALFRDGEQLEAFEVSEAESLPATRDVLDSNPAPGVLHEYVCGVWLDDALIHIATIRATGGPPPPAPTAPTIDTNDAVVEVSWEAQTGQWTVVLRRDVLAGGEPGVISPALQDSSWIDEDVEPGSIYAYSLRAISILDDVPWQSDASAEQYVEVPAD